MSRLEVKVAELEDKIKHIEFLLCVAELDKGSPISVCKRFKEFGPKEDCQVAFVATPRHKQYCSPACKKSAWETRNPNRKEV
jgi:hypothetical protein